MNSKKEDGITFWKIMTPQFKTEGNVNVSRRRKVLGIVAGVAVTLLLMPLFNVFAGGIGVIMYEKVAGYKVC